ncbi:MAG: hypothetical protein ATN33_00255, partial [Epulopiscium sp. Nele67-Bin001]
SYDFLVAVNGAYVVDDKRNVLYKRLIDNKVATAIVDMLRKDSDGQLLVQNGIDGAYIVNYKDEDEYVQHLYHKVRQLYLQTPEEALQGEVVSVGCRADRFKVAKRLNALVNATYGDLVSSYNNLTYVNVVPKNISKATGVDVVAKHCGIDASNVYTIGDDRNDIDMIDRYYSAAMDLGVEDVKQYSNIVVDTVEEYVWHILNK